MNAVLQIKQLTKAFRNHVAVDHVTFDVNAGEVFGFLGPNGAGKTTVIKMVTGFLTADEGEILINGFNNITQREKAMESVGGIVENPEMYKELSGRKNLEMYARLHGGVDTARIDEVVKMVGLENRIDDKVKSYSLGMKQRLGVAQALIHKPKLLIFDEPTNGLDPAGIRELRDILRHLAQEEGVAVLVSSHMLAEMELMCDRVGIIENGSLRSVMTVEELHHQVAGEECFLFTVQDVAKATEALAQDYPDIIRAATDGTLTLALTREDVPAVAKCLALADAGILGIAPMENSLEDAFIQITKGGNPIA